MSDSPFHSLAQFALVRERRSVVPYPFVRSFRLLPLEQREEAWLVAVATGSNRLGLEPLKLLLGPQLQEVLCSEEALEGAIEICFQGSRFVTQESGSTVSQEGLEGYDLLGRAGEELSPVALLDDVLLEAIQRGASDIHFEPQEDGLSVRIRVDGVLSNRRLLPAQFKAQILTRVKVLSHLDIAEQRLPQDGRLRLRVGARQIDFRVSTLPVLGGERIVLRILDRGNLELGLTHLQMPDELLERLLRYLSRTEGMLLVTGPTGSGKTTTLYSALKQIDSSEINLMTVEDPIEYRLPGVAQIGVNPKIDLTFAAALRHVLRQDPDVVMVGEIRDAETAQIAVQAALTGHLVLSTLHTNDAPSALTRLVDMGIEPFLLSSSVIGVLAQRLVRCLCPHCRQPDPLHDGFFIGLGCDRCLGSGYRGRRAAYELMAVSGRIQRQVVESADAARLRDIALEEGMRTLRDDGLRIAALGETSLSEVLRVTRGSED